jgi:hypothetical protein
MICYVAILVLVIACPDDLPHPILIDVAKHCGWLLQAGFAFADIIILARQVWQNRIMHRPPTT